MATNLKYKSTVQSIKFNSGSTPTNFLKNRLNLLITFHRNFLTNKKKSPYALPEHPTHYVITYTGPEIRPLNLNNALKIKKSKPRTTSHQKFKIPYQDSSKANTRNIFHQIIVENLRFIRLHYPVFDLMNER